MRQEYILYAPSVSLGGSTELPKDEATHFLKSLRGRSGDTIKVTDGCGRLFSTEAFVDKSVVTIQNCKLIEEIELEQLPRLAVGQLKHSDRMEWLVEKAVEIGVSEIIWLTTEKSAQYGYRSERMERIAISAMKQSGRLWLPKITAPVDFSEWLHHCETTSKFIAHCFPNAEKLPLANAIIPNHTNSILVGPEADFSEKELNLALSFDFTPVSLGDFRLRTETAALYALTLLSGK